MHAAIIQRIMGQFLMLFSITLLPPVVIDLLYQEDAARAFFYSYLLLLSAGFLLYLPVRKQKNDLRLRDGFIVVVLFWIVLGIAGAVPFYLYENLDISITDALFESISGLTTTGATVLIHLDSLPHSILFYRQELQWLGGMGIIVLAVAVMPMLGIGGMQLYKAEAPGPVKDNKLTPRIAETAKALWYIYLGLTIACAGAYWFAGMNLFDAVAHSFSTVAIGGFSTDDASIGYCDQQQQAAPAAPASVAESASAPIVVPAGTRLFVTMDSELDSRKHGVGHRFIVTLDINLVVSGNTVATKGTKLYGQTTNVGSHLWNSWCREGCCA